MMTWAFLLGYFAVVALAGCAALWAIWRPTSRVRNVWLRSIPRSFVVAAALAPTVVPVPEIHGALPLPAAWVLFCGLTGYASDDRLHDIQSGIVPIAVLVIPIWLVAVAVSSFRARLVRAKENG